MEARIEAAVKASNASWHCNDNEKNECQKDAVTI